MLCMQAVARSAGLVIYSYRFSCCTSFNFTNICTHIMVTLEECLCVADRYPAGKKYETFFGRLGSSCILEMALLVGLRRRASPDGR